MHEGEGLENGKCLPVYLVAHASFSQGPYTLDEGLKQNEEEVEKQ